MRLSDAYNMTLEESALCCRYITILEEDEGPRWKFRYDNFNLDPRPDILLLGAYRHPGTGNDLVGGINLHYLGKSERDQLARKLPEIMSGRNLKERYWIGRRAVPRVFEQYYRTYNSDFIRGVTKDVMYPKYGLAKTTKQWLKKKLGSIFKTKAQRKKEAEPQYPDDLEGMQDRLDQVVQQLQQRQQEQPTEVEPDTPEMQAARDAFRQFQRERTLRDIERREDIPMRQAQHDATEPEPEAPEPEVPEIDPQQARQELERNREQNRRELMNPENEISDDDQFEESIAYYSPIAGHTIFEPFRPFAHDNKPIVSEGWGTHQTLSGEFWLNDGFAMEAENDYDHTLHAIQAARAFLAEELELDVDDEHVEWEEIQTFLAEQYPELAEEIMMSYAGPRPNLEKFLAQYGVTMELWDVAAWMGETEPRVYAAREWGWVRLEGNNIETFTLTRSKLREIARGLGDAHEPMERDLEKENFDIYVYSTKRFYNNVPFDVIEAGDMATLRDHDKLQRGVA